MEKSEFRVLIKHYFLMGKTPCRRNSDLINVMGNILHQDISIGSEVKILHEDLEMRKLAAKWVPRLLTIDRKHQRVRDTKSCLNLFNHNSSVFLRQLVTIDETWIHHYTTQSKK